LLGYPAEAVDGLNGYIARNLATAKKASRAGVRFAMGSDAVYTMFGENTRELSWFVKAGMTPEQALKTATVNAVELLGQEKSLGALHPGYLADLVAVEGDPLADIQVAIDKVRWVMKAAKWSLTRRNRQPSGRWRSRSLFSAPITRSGWKPWRTIWPLAGRVGAPTGSVQAKSATLSLSRLRISRRVRGIRRRLELC